ncbi:MAG: AAA family ATPase, partial [Cetobacterium sp.]
KEIEENFRKDNIKRVTFYDGYTYGQFVGAYKPVMYKNDNNVKEIGYEFIAGPLLEQVLNAYNYPQQDFIVVIEEINRAKVDRVFGDIFQLLDRNSQGDSEYPISLSQEQDNYFKENLDGKRYLETIDKKEGLYLPNNLYLWATMNSVDQGVYPMDTAFKRRWDFDYISLNKNQREEKFLVEIDNKKYNWNDYRETLNDILGEQGVTEDRLISPYFLKVTDFDEYKVLKESSYVNKFLMYIFDDILKHNNRLKEALFTEKNFYKIFSKLQNGNQIYSTNFMDRLNERPKKVDDEKTEE